MARRSMSRWDVEAWLSTSRSILEGARVDNVYEDQGVFILKVKPPIGDYKLLVAESGRRIHFSRRVSTVPAIRPKGLLALLRKYCRGSKIREVRQLAKDRVIVFDLNNDYKIVLELLPRGLLVLLDPDNLVKGASSYVELRDRTVKPRKAYHPPPLEELDPPSLDPKRALELLHESKGKDLVRALVRGLRIPGEVAEEALYRSGVDPRLRPGDVDAETMKAILEELKKLKTESLEGRGYIGFRGETPLEAVPFKPTRMEYRYYSSFDEALDDFFALLVEPATSDPELEKLVRSLEEARKTAEEYKRRAEELRLIAEHVSANYYAFKSLLECASSKNPLSCPGVKEVKNGKIVVEVLGAQLVVNPREGLDRLVVRLFKEAGELESKAKRAERVMLESQQRINELKLKARVRELRSKLRTRERKWFERYHWTITTNGFIAVGGRDASQNESVVRRYLGPNDIFLHADIHGAPAVVLITRGREPSSEDIEDAAYIAAAYSKAWKAGIASVSVYWVRGSQVSRSPPAGEYLSKGGFMVYGRKNYLSPLQLKIYLGIALDDEGLPIVIQGSRRIVERASIAFAELVPGDLKAEEALERIRSGLAALLPEEEKHLILAMDKNEIASRLPGRSRITGYYRGERRGLLLKE